MKENEITQEALAYLAIFKLASKLIKGLAATAYIGATFGIAIGIGIVAMIEEHRHLIEDGAIAIVGSSLVAGMAIFISASLYYRIRTFNVELKEFCVKESGLSKETISLWID